MTSVKKISTMSESKAAKAASDTKTRRPRTVSLSDIRCGIANCSYSAKRNETVERHRQKVHEIEPNRSLLDCSVSASILDDTAVVSETDTLASSLELKTSSEFYNDMSKVEQSTQLETRRRKRSSDSEGEEEEEKRLKLNAEHPKPNQTQSPGKEERDNLCAEAMAALKERTDGENLDTSKSLLEDTSVAGATNSAILEGLNAGDMSSSQSQLMTTAQETYFTFNVNNAATDSIIKALKDGLGKPNADVVAKDAKILVQSNKTRKKHHEERKLKKDEKKKEEASKGEEVKEEKEEEDEKVKDDSEKLKAKKRKRNAAKKSKTESNGGQSTAMENDETSDPAASTGSKAADIAKLQSLGPKPQAQQPTSTSSSNPQHVEPNFQLSQIQTNFNFGQPQFPAAPPTLAPAGSAPWSAQWSGPSPAELAMEQAIYQEAVQAQAMSRRMRLDNLRNELSSVQARLMTVHTTPPGCTRWRSRGGCMKETSKSRKLKVEMRQR